ncbi:MAG: DUF3826 domain-containing protein [Puniceicoccaceae bacterium]
MLKFKIQLLSAICLAALLPANGYGLDAASVDEYKSVATGRAEKIVTGMQLADPAIARKLVEVIAGQYCDLFAIHEIRDAALKQLTEYDHGFESLNRLAREGIEAGAREAVDNAHRQFVARVESLVGSDGLEAVKNGMTYHVAPNTYGVYMQMLPDLDDEGKALIKAWLWEAREYAMDAGSSDEKHKWFGKYKGRINNYLSSRGVDLKEAERAMWARLKEEKTSP